ncbi:MAG: hypothetical protein LC115_08815 [Bacteroidia bacterium]|nr:hypothetical protein [Bacteroidia bacterium]
MSYLRFLPKRLICCFYIQLLFFSVNAQVVQAEADIWTEVPPNIPLVVAKDQAKDAAIKVAIESAFGSAIYQNSSLSLETTNGKTNSDFRLRSDSYMRGVWLETLSLSQQTEIRKQQGLEKLWLHTRISGHARKLKTAPANVAIAFANCPAISCESTTFFSGERLYLLAESDTKGFLTIFLDDRTTAYQLLPYQRMPEKQPFFELQARQQYVLFSNKLEHNYFSQDPYFQEDELMISADKPEYYRLYALWTAHEVAPPKVKSAEYSNPGELSSEKFQQWLSQILSQEEQAVIQIVDVSFLPKSGSN